MKVSLVVIVFLLALTPTIVYADGGEDWGIQVKTSPPLPNKTPNDMKALNLTLQDFMVECPTAQVSRLTYNETTFKLSFSVSVVGEYSPLNITFPTTVQNPAQNVGVYVDSQHNSYILSAREGRFVLSFELSKGLHQCSLNLDPAQFPLAAIPEFSGVSIILLILAILTVGVLVARRNRKIVSA